jgi:hypothetical protein
MTDVLVRGVSPEDVARIDALAKGQGLSRAEYLRHLLRGAARREALAVSPADFERLADLGADLLDDGVMAAAWR